MSLEDYLKKQKENAAKKAGEMKNSAEDSWDTIRDKAKRTASDINENFT